MLASFAFAQTCLVDDECNDGYFCNGVETCDPDTEACVEGTPPCTESEICDEESDACVGATMVSVDIKPGSCPNPLNVKSRGVLPVAILGSDNIDVTTIDPETILITRKGIESVTPVAPIRYNYDDVGTPSDEEPCSYVDLNEDDLDVVDLNGDGITDLILKFKVPELVEGLGLKEVESREIIFLSMMGGTEDDSLIMGEDCVKIINKFKWWEDLLEKIKKPKKPKNPKNPDEE
jgi:hypothetical protein